MRWRRARHETRNMINQASTAVAGSTSMSSWLQRQAPVLTLVLLPALLIEVLYGATPLDRLYVVVPEVLVYGCGALIIRTVVRMRGLDWISILVLGVAFAVAEECVILQTSLSPFFFGGYGRVLGVNTVYFLAMLGYESVWAILLPILLTEIIFPARREQPWIGGRGLAAFWLALPWFGLTIVAYAAPPLSPLITIAAGISWAAGVTLVVRHWTSGSDFGDRHRLALIIGALTASWLEGFIIVSSAGAVDAIGKLVLDLLAIALLGVLAREVKRRVRSNAPGSSASVNPRRGEHSSK